MEKIMNLKYRLGLDLGATSIGWAIYDICNNNLVDFGVRIFDDGREDKTKVSLCVKRRDARSARRRQSRKHIQKAELIKILLKYGLLPSDKNLQQKMKNWNPYALRVKALDEQISLFELGRICFQLVQRKGFLSNRKDNKEEGGKLKQGYIQLNENMASVNARTYGEYLYQKLINGETPRLKDKFDETTGKFKGGEFPFRQTYKDEFEQIFNKQQTFYPTILTNECRNKIADILFYQRPLKEQDEGCCTFEISEKRIPKAHPLFQEFRIWQHLLNLSYSSPDSNDYESLTLEQHNRLLYILHNPVNYVSTKQPIITYKSIKTLLNLDKNGIFNFEQMSTITDDCQKGILADTTEYMIMKSSFVSAYWKNFTSEEKNRIIMVLARPEQFITFPKTKISTEMYDNLIINYLKQSFSLTAEAATELLYNIDLEDGYASLSEKAIQNILPHMKQGIPYDEACRLSGYHHSHKTYEKLELLPYYGKILQQSCTGQKINPQNDEEHYGKINNATVHIALNQVRYLVNDIINHYGKPYDISIEYARDLSASALERQKMSNTRDKNELENKKIIEELNSKIQERKWTSRDIEKYKIWKNLGVPKGESAFNYRECPFTGTKISVSDLINGEHFQIEHLIPFSRSLDNSIHNKVLATVDANRYKGNRTPYEAFGESKDGYQWNEIQSRVKKLPLEQQWRFGKDAMKKFEKKEGPIARSLNDTRYMTRILQDYLLPIVRDDGKKTVQSVVGALTAMVRKSWGLNLYKEDKESDDYRAYHNHHAVDAIIVASIDRAQINSTAHHLKKVSSCALAYFRDELYKLKSENITEDEKKDLRKRIKNFVIEKENGIIKEYIHCPESFNIPELIRKVQNINISHKPKLKNPKDISSTIGKLHEDKAYGLQKFMDNTSLKVEFKSGKKDKKDKKIKELIEYIPAFYNKEDKNEYYDAFKNWYIVESKAKISNEKVIKKQLQQHEADAVQKLRESAQKAFKWFVGGGNYCAEIYQINPQNKIGNVVTKNAGDWESEIISNYNATVRIHRGEDYFYWKNRYPNAKRIMTLKRNDMVVGTFTIEQSQDEKFPKGIQEIVQSYFVEHPDKSIMQILFRVKKISSSGTITLTPHNLAKEKDDTKSWLSSAGSLQKYHAQKVFVSTRGKITYAKQNN